jgi:hypothetical protein
LTKDELRRFVTERASGRCEYCQANALVIVIMELDHIIPRAQGGETTTENLCLYCRHCNGYKHNFLTGIDPQTQTEQPLFNPRTQAWTDHFRWDDEPSLLLGRTPTGRATIQRLQINREMIVKARKLWIEAGWHPPK